MGEAVLECGVPRGELFLTTKVWITNAGYEKAKMSIEESLRELKTDYLDARVIIRPSQRNPVKSRVEPDLVLLF